MTREEAINTLREIEKYIAYDNYYAGHSSDEVREALTVLEEDVETFEALNAINLDLASENEDLVERIGKLIGFIDFLRNTAQGKKKSLNLLEKVVKGQLEEIRAEEPFINKPCISEGVCKVDAAKMLEHIDEEVKNLFEPDDFDNSGCYNEALFDVLEILNSHARRLTDETN